MNETAPFDLLVIGGGIIGLEMATVYAALGVKVSVVELTDGLMQLFSARRPAVGEAALDENRHTLADKTVDFSLSTRWLADFFKHQSATFSQVGDRVEQGSVEVEGNGLEVHFRIQMLVVRIK